MKRHAVMYGALALTLAATAYVTLQPDAEEPVVATALPAARPVLRQTAAPPAAPATSSLRRRGWTVLTPEALSAWAPPPPPRTAATAGPRSPEPAPEPPRPKPPAFPYRWIGSLEQDGVLTAMLDGAQRSLGARAGQVLDGQWRVERISENRIDLTWLSTGDTVALDKR